MKRLLAALTLVLLAAGPLAGQTPLSDKQLRQRLVYQLAQLVNARTAIEASIAHAQVTLDALQARIARDSLAGVVIAPEPIPSPAPSPVSAPTGALVADDFERTTAIEAGWSSVWNPGSIAIVAAPGGRAGKVTRYTYSTAAGAANDRNVALTHFVGGSGLRHFFVRGYVYIPVTGTGNVEGKRAWQRKLLYFKDVGENDHNNFVLALHGDGDGDGIPSVRIISIVRDKDVSPTGPGGYTGVEFPLGQWVYLEVEIAANTPGRNDGAIRVWVNDPNTPAYQRTDANLFGSLSEGYGTLMIGQQLQTGDGDPAQTEYRYWDDVAISTVRLGP